MNLEGFNGFIPVKEMAENYGKIPAIPGVYVVIRESEDAPEFLAEGTGGFFKRRNPNVGVAELEAKFIKGCPIQYIGKATDLKKRLRQLISFGKGNAVGHWGGRYLWQLADSSELKIAWKPILDKDSREEEKAMLREFEAEFGSLPFANKVH